jgi:hypothetical protein
MRGQVTAGFKGTKMSGSLKLGLYILIGVIVVWFGIKLLMSLVATILPILILGAVVLVVVGLVSQKALGGGRRTLP